MSYLGSRAVMQQRLTRAPHELDYFPTPPWATRALCEFLARDCGMNLAELTAWEPACGEMHMARPLAEYFADVRASDVFRYLPEHEIADFILAAAPVEARGSVDFVISNPPFILAKEFIQAALKVARIGVAMLVRTSFAEGKDRYHQIWAKNPPSFELVFSERVVMLKGRLVRAGEPDPFSDPPGKIASTATSYVWVLWLKYSLEWGCRKRWIAPSRLDLERPGDYPDYSAGILPPPADGLFGESAAA